MSPGINSNLFFWFDAWALDTPLWVRFPCLFQLEAVKNCKLKDRVIIRDDEHSIRFHWNRQLCREEHMQVTVLLEQIPNTQWAGEENIWKNDLCETGIFSIKNIRCKIRQTYEIRLNKSFPWCKWIPIKVNVLFWRVWLDRLPTKENLVKRNINNL